MIPGTIVSHYDVEVLQDVTGEGATIIEAATYAIALDRLYEVVTIQLSPLLLHASDCCFHLLA